MCSDRVITKQANIQISVCATVTKLSMWVVVVGRSTTCTHVICCHQMHIRQTSFAYLFWFANNKKVNIENSVWTTVTKLAMLVVVVGRNSSHLVCHHQMCIFDTSFAYLFWLADNKTGKYPEFSMGYSDETWYEGSSEQKYYPQGSDLRKDIFPKFWNLQKLEIAF